MNDSQSGVLDQSIHETPIAVIDFETTGLAPGLDRVVEVSVVRHDPAEGSRVVLDTLVNPRRPIADTEIHGITDSDVADAPTFNEIAGDLVRALSDCPVAAYNVYFDIKFLASELQQVGLDVLPPHFCLMYLRPMLGIGPRCTLEEACQEHDISYAPVHAAAQDALAATKLMELYLGKMKTQGIDTFGELAKLKDHKFVDSFNFTPLPASLATPFARCNRLKSRNGHATQSSQPTVATPASVARRNPEGVYWDALKTVLSDFRITDEEIAELLEKKQELRLEDEQIWAIHAKAFVGVLSQFVVDNYLDETERRVINRLYRCLSALGWAPGEN